MIHANVVDYIKKHGPIPLKDGGSLNISLNLIEIFSRETSCMGCYLQNRTGSCIDTFYECVKPPIAKYLHLIAMGCSCAGEQPMILIRKEPNNDRLSSETERRPS